jgi:glycosyltransferase involved in cell wall biosynthesis
LIEVKNFTRSINPLKDLKAISEVKRIAKNVKPDIIHLHSSKAGVVGRIAFNGKDVPLFYTPHGYSFLMENYKVIKRHMFYMIEAAMAKRNCTTISCSLGEHQETMKLTKRAKYVNNGINIVELEQMLKKVEKVDHPFTVFTLGRICYQKNPVLFNAVAESMPDTRFLWIGEGELAGELMSDNVEITGWVNREKALQLSMNADVFLLTSLWEGLPISLLESMYMKKLCVVNDVIGNHDVIRNGENGFVCRTVEEFKKAIENAHVDSLISTAFDEIKQTYNTSVMGKNYAQIYESKD